MQPCVDRELSSPRDAQLPREILTGKDTETTRTRQMEW